MTILAVNAIQASASIAQKGSFKNSRSYLLSSKILLERVMAQLSQNTAVDQLKLAKQFKKFSDFYKTMIDEIRNAQQVENERRFNRFVRTRRRSVERASSRSRSPTIRRERENDRDRNDAFSNVIYRAKGENFRTYNRSASPPNIDLLPKDISPQLPRSRSPVALNRSRTPDLRRSPSARSRSRSKSRSRSRSRSRSPVRKRSISPPLRSNRKRSRGREKDRDHTKRRLS